MSGIPGGRAHLSKHAASMGRGLQMGRFHLDRAVLQPDRAYAPATRDEQRTQRSTCLTVESRVADCRGGVTA
jgi:hypothetical protein